MKISYDRLAAGERLRQKRTLLGFTQDEMAEKIDRAAKYYADIERGSCGMSVETLMALSAVLDMSLDYIIYGTTSSDREAVRQSDEIPAILDTLNSFPAPKQKYALRMLRLFLAACDSTPSEDI